MLGDAEKRCLHKLYIYIYINCKKRIWHANLNTVDRLN